MAEFLAGLPDRSGCSTGDDPRNWSFVGKHQVCCSSAWKITLRYVRRFIIRSMEKWKRFDWSIHCFVGRVPVTSRDERNLFDRIFCGLRMICISLSVCSLFTLDHSFIFFFSLSFVSFELDRAQKHSFSVPMFSHRSTAFDKQPVEDKEEEERQSILPRLSLDQVYWLSFVADLSGYPAISSNVMVIAQSEKTCCFIRQIYLRQLETYERGT